MNKLLLGLGIFNVAMGVTNILLGYLSDTTVGLISGITSLIAGCVMVPVALGLK